MMLIITPGFGDLTPSIAKQLHKVVGVAMGTTVFRIRVELIFHRCGNLITPSQSCGGSPPDVGAEAIADCPQKRKPHLGEAELSDGEAGVGTARFMTRSTAVDKGSTDIGAGSGPRPIYSRCGSRDIVSKQRTMLTRQRCGGGHAGRRFLGYSSKAPLVRRCIALGQTAGSGLRHYQPARGGAHRGCSESRDLRQRQLSAAAVWPPRSRLTAVGQHADSPAGFLESSRG
jgi:hypothetical protein